MKTESIYRTIEIEGGYQNDKFDRGNYTPKQELKGTKYGISARAYPDLDIYYLTKQEAFEIYERDYWNKIIIDIFPDNLKPMLFDMAVNHGVVATAKMLQRSVNVADDGVIGPVTIKAVVKRGKLSLLAAERAIYFASIVQRRTSQVKFIKGWNNRIKDIIEFTYEICSSN